MIINRKHNSKIIPIFKEKHQSIRKVMKLNRALIFIFAVVGMLPPIIFRAIDLYNGIPVSGWSGFLKTILTSVITTVTISIGVVSQIIWLQKDYPWQEGIAKRLFLEIVITTLTACSLIVIVTLIFEMVEKEENLPSALFRYIIVAIIMNFVLVAVTEGIFFFRQWKNSLVEAERFKKESIRAQFESLKNQVNPHFLFNSLNTLSSLIDEDKNMSKEFLDNLSAVYRYVLQHKNEELVSLRTELDFIAAYTQLLKKRHGEKVVFNINIDEKELSKGIPPMTLQMLIENAVKHNIATRKKPLTVEVLSKADQLVVRNNLQRKKEVQSTGIGLKNIERRYQYLVEKKIKIQETEQHFEVSIPTITMV